MMFRGDFEGGKVRNQEAAPPLRVSLPGNQVDGLPGNAVMTRIHRPLTSATE